MGWFVKRYGNVTPKLPIEDFDYIYRKFGYKAAVDVSKKVQEGLMSLKTLHKYLY